VEPDPQSGGSAGSHLVLIGQSSDSEPPRQPDGSTPLMFRQQIADDPGRGRHSRSEGGVSFEVTGADYLRRLKAGELTGRDPVAPEPAPGFGDSAKPPSVERRLTPRYPCQGSIKFQQEGSDVQSWGTFTDVSLHRCYVEVTATFPVGTRLALTPEMSGLRAEMIGEVRVTYSFLGMGIAFRDLEDDTRRQLTESVRSVAHPARVLNAPPPAKAVAPAQEKFAAPAADPRRTLGMLIAFLRPKRC
jgi:hypothetical protein